MRLDREGEVAQDFGAEAVTDPDILEMHDGNVAEIRGEKRSLSRVLNQNDSPIRERVRQPAYPSSRDSPMLIVCPSCESEFAIDPALLRPKRAQAALCKLPRGVLHRRPRGQRTVSTRMIPWPPVCPGAMRGEENGRNLKSPTEAPRLAQCCSLRKSPQARPAPETWRRLRTGRRQYPRAFPPDHRSWRCCSSAS